MTHTTNQRNATALAAEILRLRAMNDFGGQGRERTRDLVDIIGSWHMSEGKPVLRYRTQAGDLTPDFDVAMKTYL